MKKNRKDQTPSSSARHSGKGSRWVPFAIGALGIIASVSLWGVFERAQRQVIDEEFRRIAKEHVQSTSTNVERALEDLYAVHAFYAASKDVSADEFQIFTSDGRDRHHILHTILWTPLVSDAERQANERLAHNEGNDRSPILQRDADGQMVPAADRAEYYPVRYISPRQGNESLLGFDLASDPAIRGALLEAASANDLTATPRIELCDETGGRVASTVALLPFYRDQSPDGSTVDGRGQLEGFVVGCFRIDDLIGKTIADVALGSIDFSIYDATASDRLEHLYTHHSRPHGADDASRQGSSIHDGFDGEPVVLSFPVANRRWQVRYTATPAFLAERRTSGPLYVLAVGLLVTCLLGRYFLLLTNHTTDVERQVADRTAELRHSREHLAAINRQLTEVSLLHKTILDGTRYAIVSTDPGGIIRTFNLGAEQMFGYSAEELVGKSTPAILHVEVEVAARAAELSRELSRPIEPGFESLVAKARLGDVEEREWTCIRKDGSRLPALLSVAALRHDGGEFFGFVGITQDVTDRKETETRMAQQALEAKLLHQVTVLAAETDDIDQVVQHCVDAVCELSGWPVGHAYFPADDGREVLVPSTIWSLADGRDYKPFCDVTTRSTFAPGVGLPGRIWASGDPAWIVNVQTDDNFPRAKQCDNVGVKGAFGFPVKVNGHIVAVLEFFADDEMEQDGSLLAMVRSLGEQVGRVLERKQAQANLRKAKEAAEEANRTKSEFLANMSHELRTPLNGVIGMAELLAGTKLSEKQQQFLDACRSSAESLLKVINDILDFSKIEAGKLELDLHDFDLEKLVTSTVDTMAWRAADKSLEIPCYVDQVSRMVLKGDSNRLRQILVNILANAIKFTESGEVVVRTQTVRREDKQILVRFSVSDTGIGIPPDKLDGLFQSFSQVDASTTRNYGGSGLGLSISQGLVQQMGGTIGVESEEGVGSTFWFEVPFVLVSESTEELPTTSPLAGRRVLIVDNNETSQVFLGEYSAEWGLLSVTTASVDEALAAVDRAESGGTPFHLVLTVYNMPERSGLDLARALKDRPQRIVLLVSATDIQMIPSELREHGIDATLRKPIRRHELHDVICGLFSNVEEAAQPAAEKPSPTSDLPLRTGHILLAEDNSINQMYVVELMKELGCTCDTVINGRQASEAVQQRKYDLVLMDCQMPEMDGFEATRHIRQLESDGTLDGHLPIIALTANAINGDRERCLDAGMDDYLSKPAQADQIRSVLARALGREYRQESQTHAMATTQDEAVQPCEPPPIGAEPLLARCFGNLEFANSLLDELESTGQERVDEIRRQARDEDAAAMAEAAHALKGAAGILCAESVQELAAQIEQAGRSSNTRDLDTPLRNLDAEMQRCLDYLPQLREELKTVKVCV